MDKNHSKHGQWAAHTHDDKIFEDCINETDEKKWTMYYKYGTRLQFDNEIDYHKFNYQKWHSNSNKNMSNGNLYRNSSVQIEEDQSMHHGLLNAWDHFVSTQPPWMKKLLEGVQF